MTFSININFVEILVEATKKLYSKKSEYVHNKKHSLEDYFNEIIKFFRNCTYWRRYTGAINGRVLNNKFNEFVNMGVFDSAYQIILEMYMKNNNIMNLKFQSTDTYFVKNKLCIDNIGRNVKYKSKKGIKISSIVDMNGVPLSLICDKCNIHDSKLFIDTKNNMLVDTNPLKYQYTNKYKQYLLADTAYDSKKIRDKLINDGYNPIIEHNKRNTKDKTKIKSLTKHERQLYKNRIVIENFHSWLAQYPKMNMVTDKLLKTFRGCVYLCSSIILFNKL